MQKIVILPGLLLAIGGCQGMHQRLGMMEGKEEAGQGGLNTWFESFVDVVDNAEEWDTIETSLDQGKKSGYLDKNVAWGDDQYTPLHYAAQEGDLDVVKELIEKHKVSVDIRAGTYQRIPLHLAALRGHLEVVKYLVDEKHANWKDADTSGSNALHYAALGIQGKANTEVVKFLKEQGADLEALANDKFSLLHLAARANNASLVEYLMQQCPRIVDNEAGINVKPIELARAMHSDEIVDIIQKKLEEEDGPCWQLSKGCNIH